VAIEAAKERPRGASGLHPALLDACLHLYPALVDAYGDFTQAVEEPRRVYLPVGVERFRCAGVRIREVWVHGVRRQGGNEGTETLTVDIAIYGDDGSFTSEGGPSLATFDIKEKAEAFNASG
jgi:epothilone polyketide synthase C